MTRIRPATSQDLPALGRTLAAAFHDDPIWTWLTPDPARYQRGAPRFFETDARLKLGSPHQVLVDDDVTGAAVWLAPDHWKGTLREALKIARPATSIFGSRFAWGIKTLLAIEKNHPVDPPHWFLSVIGTHPDHQGKGIGNALIEAVTDRCDDEGLPAYLESSKEENVSYYARHGFEVTQELAMPGSCPPVWLMWREPR